MPHILVSSVVPPPNNCQTIYSGICFLLEIRKSALLGGWWGGGRVKSQHFRLILWSLYMLNPIFEVYYGNAKSIKISRRYDIDTFVRAVNTLAHAGGFSLKYKPRIFALPLVKSMYPDPYTDAVGLYDTSTSDFSVNSFVICDTTYLVTGQERILNHGS